MQATKNNSHVLEFDPELHIYRLNGVIIPGFSEVAKTMRVYDFSNVPEYLLETTRVFGDAAHYLTKLWDLNDLDERTVDEPLMPCLEGYKFFLKDYNIEIIKEKVENPICSYLYRYGVTPDRVCFVKGELSVLELKFVSKLLPAVALQTAAQKRAVEEYYNIKIKRRYALQITQKGKCMPLVEYKDRSDDNAWLCFLGSYNWLRRNGNGKRNN